MSKTVFDSFVQSGEKLNITIHREDGTLLAVSEYTSGSKGGVVSIVTEDY